MVMMTGLMLTALPVAIIGRNYAILYEYNQKRMKRRRREKREITNRIMSLEQQEENNPAEDVTIESTVIHKLVRDLTPIYTINQ